MKQKIFNYVVGVIFSIIAILHLVRSIFGWEAQIGGVEIVIGVSVVAFILAGFLAYTAFSLTRKGNDNQEIKDEENIIK
ncbi:hypothetical protein A2645_00935 [Candidatus Nomurabacteria bacterium RIFCSPHIGHO2_01_FULL_39_9]|uniref:Uncharacterized protein n=1 Tax=Candidatus Nomurabacteria bacterium RIFCSPHIGHO2_01_FULL_39_9 TaxID=1801735 RepID=A0A1F6UWR4_9BACT|nr:MAG: hypothetical protein A2645_00935 [Candidatus Nomurabacteria bacterium RIFCSPHIGHO2_01_FULL_39_9]